MTLVGSNDLQARSAYQPVIQKQGNRWIAYIGHHGGEMPNLLTGELEPNGTSIVDVTNVKQPKYIAHIPGAKDANAKIVDGFHKLAGNFHDMAKQARAKDLAGLTKALSAFQTSDGAQEIQKAQDELASAGYKIQGG